MVELSDRLHSWAAGGRTARVADTDVWYAIRGRGPWLVCFHGFPTSSWDWHRLLPLLAAHYRVLVFDFPGYGLSAKPPQRNYSILRQMDTAQALLKALDITEFDLLSHDMGDTVACELLHRLEQNETALRPRSLTMLNGGIYPQLHQPLLTQKLLRTPLIGALTARFSSWRVFRHQYPKIYADPASFSEQHYREQWALMLNNEGRRTLARVAVYMRERRRYRDRWQGPLHRLKIPIKLIWGDRDPVAVYGIARKLKKENAEIQLLTLEGIGHYPQLESPGAVFEGILGFASE